MSDPLKKSVQGNAPVLDPKLIAELDRQQASMEENLFSIADSLEIIALYYRRKGEQEKIFKADDFDSDE